MLGVLQARKGVRLQGGLVNLVGAGVGNPLAIFMASNYAVQIGIRTFRIKRIKGLNQAGVNSLIYIGVGAAGPPAVWTAAIMPALFTNNGLNFDFVEADLPEIEIGVGAVVGVVQDLMAYTVTAPVFIQVEVEELG